MARSGRSSRSGTLASRTTTLPLRPLRHERQYPTDPDALRLQRATHYNATDVRTINHILDQKLYLLPLEPILPKQEGEEPVGARELTYYTVYDAHTVSLPT